jgi:ribosome biogenesis protein Nip4
VGNPGQETKDKEEESMMQFTQPDSEINLMIETAIHKKLITRQDFQKIMTLAGQELKIEAHEKQLLCHLQGMMKNRSTGGLP